MAFTQLFDLAFRAGLPAGPGSQFAFNGFQPVLALLCFAQQEVAVLTGFGQFFLCLGQFTPGFVQLVLEDLQGRQTRQRLGHIILAVGDVFTICPQGS